MIILVDKYGREVTAATVKFVGASAVEGRGNAVFAVADIPEMTPAPPLPEISTATATRWFTGTSWLTATSEIERTAHRLKTATTWLTATINKYTTRMATIESTVEAVDEITRTAWITRTATDWKTATRWFTREKTATIWHTLTVEGTVESTSWLTKEATVFYTDFVTAPTEWRTATATFWHTLTVAKTVTKFHTVYPPTVTAWNTSEKTVSRCVEPPAPPSDCNDCDPPLPSTMEVTIANCAGAFAAFNGTWTLYWCVGTCRWRTVEEQGNLPAGAYIDLRESGGEGEWFIIAHLDNSCRIEWENWNEDECDPTAGQYDIFDIEDEDEESQCYEDGTWSETASVALGGNEMAPVVGCGCDTEGTQKGSYSVSVETHDEIDVTISGSSEEAGWDAVLVGTHRLTWQGAVPGGIGYLKQITHDGTDYDMSFYTAGAKWHLIIRPSAGGSNAWVWQQNIGGSWNAESSDPADFAPWNAPLAGRDTGTYDAGAYTLSTASANSETESWTLNYLGPCSPCEWRGSKNYACDPSTTLYGMRLLRVGLNGGTNQRKPQHSASGQHWLLQRGTSTNSGASWSWSTVRWGKFMLPDPRGDYDCELGATYVGWQITGDGAFAGTVRVFIDPGCTEITGYSEAVVT